MKVSVDFDNEYKYREILDKYPFNECQRIMSELNWKYYTSPNTPTISDLKSTLYSLLIGLKGGCIRQATGGFEVSKVNDKIIVNFNVGGYFFTNKSDNWDFDDKSSLLIFMGKVKKISYLINSPLALLVNDYELMDYIERNSDTFIDDDIDEKRLLDFHFEREIYDEGEMAYTLSFKCFNMEF